MTWKPLPGPAERPEPRPLKHSLDRVTRSFKGPNADVLSAVFAHWTDIVGPVAAAHSWPLSLTAGVLSVAVDQPGWATQMSYLEADLKRRIHEVSGVDAVRQVRLSVRSDRPPNW